MCVGIPARVCEILEDERALVELGGARQEISLALVEDVEVGDYVIVHVGYALNRLDPEQAEETLDLLRQIAGHLEQQRPPGDQ